MTIITNIYTGLFESIVEAAPNAMIVVNTRGEVVYLNAQTEKMFGYSRNELAGQLIEVLIPDNYRLSHIQMRDEFFKNPNTRAMGAGRELFGKRKDGIAVPIEIGLNPVSASGETFVIASVIDISERKKADNRFRLAVEAAPNAMLMVDKTGRILMSNKQAEQLFRYERNQLIGAMVEMLVPEGVRPMHPTYRQEYNQNPKMRAMGAGRDLYGVRSDGVEVPIEIGLTPVESENELLILASIIDITERKKNEQLVAAREAALEASELKSQFLANMSHEIRTPMNAIIAMTELLMEKKFSSEDKSSVELINNSAQSLLTIINDILDFSKIEAGKLDLEFIPHNVEDVFRDIESMFKPNAEKKKIKFTVDQVRVGYPLLMDPNRLKQVLSNLVNNAIKFTSDGFVSVKCYVLREADSRLTLRVEVIDSGIGISEDGLNRLFQTFSQADNTTSRKFGGTGLGLSICRKLVELMNGKIGVNSNVGIGSTFWMELDFPRAAAHLDKKNKLTHQAITQDYFSPFARVLVAEDYIENQIVVGKMLDRIGLKYKIANNGNEAIEMIHSEKFDAVLMDCQMPVLDGYEATSRLRGEENSVAKEIPIIAMTANAIKGDKEKCIACGMNDYISKPISLKVLFETLQKWVPAKSE